MYMEMSRFCCDWRLFNSIIVWLNNNNKKNDGVQQLVGVSFVIQVVCNIESGSSFFFGHFAQPKVKALLLDKILKERWTGDKYCGVHGDSVEVIVLKNHFFASTLSGLQKGLE